MSNLRIGDPVQIDETTEVLVLCAVDGDAAWCRDGAGNHITHKLVDLVRARSRAHREIVSLQSLLEQRQREQSFRYEDSWNRFGHYPVQDWLP